MLYNILVQRLFGSILLKFIKFKQKCYMLHFSANALKQKSLWVMITSLTVIFEILSSESNINCISMSSVHFPKQQSYNLFYHFLRYGPILPEKGLIFHFQPQIFQLSHKITLTCYISLNQKFYIEYEYHIFIPFRNSEKE